MPRPDSTTTGSTSSFPKDLEQRAVQALLQAVVVPEDHPPNKRPFLNLFHLQCGNAFQQVAIQEGLSTREQRHLLFQALMGMKPEPAATFWGALARLVEAVLHNQEHVPASAFVNEQDEDNEEEAFEIVPDAVSAAGLQFLQYAARCVSKYFESHHGKKLPSGLWETAKALHDCLDQLEDPAWGPEAVAAHAAIVALCETWWLKQGPDAEQVIVQALPCLVQAVLSLQPQQPGGGTTNSKAALKRLYALRKALTVIDFADPASDNFAALLLRLASAPHCLKVVEGQRLLAFLLSQSEDAVLRTKLHRAIRAQIPGSNPKASILQALGEIYFGAWKEAADSDARAALEEDVLKELVYAVIHAEHASLAQNLRTVLEKFHDSKKNAAGQALLQRLYGPILWRSLSGANALVRVRATAVLPAVFPLSSSDKNPVARGVAALKQLLTDTDPRVRVAAAEAVATILTVYWDVLPARDIRVLLNHLVAEHASDATSAAVRVGALNAVTLLLEAPQSHAVLRELLPSLGNLIHDKVEKVRLATVRMLLRVKKVPDIKYYHIVPLDHLGARFAEEGKTNPTNSVASALTDLMVNSYFPVGENIAPAEQIRRTLKFLTDDPDAALVFYANLSKFRSVDAVARLAVKLLRCLHSAIEREQLREHKKRTAKSGKRRRRLADENDEDENADGESFPAALMASLAEAIDILWESIEKYLQGDDEWNDFLVDEFSGATLTTILSYCEEKAQNTDADDDEEAEYIRDDCYRTSAAILRCAGRLPVKTAGGLVTYISSLLEAVEEPDDHDDDEEDNDSPVDNVTSHVALLCSWDMTDEVALSLAASINSAFQGDLLVGSPIANSKKRRNRRSSGSSDHGAVAVPQLPATVALNVLSEILRGSDPSSVAAREALLRSERAFKSIEKALESGTRHAEGILAGDTMAAEAYVGYLLQVCETYGRLALHKEFFANESSVTFSAVAERLLHWTTANAIPALRPTVPFNDPNLSSIHAENSFAAFPASPEPVSRGKRTNRNKTPERLDEGLGIFDDSPSAEEAKPSAMLVARVFAISVMKSSCVLFSEWLAVTEGSGAGFIAQATANGWCQVLEAADKSAEISNALVPAFCRLATKLLSTGGESGLFQQLLSCLDEETDESENALVMHKAIVSLLASRGAEAGSIMKKTVESVVEAAYESVNKTDDDGDDDELVYQLPISLGELWRSESGCIGTALGALFGSKPASLELARQLVDRFPVHVQDKESTGMALFDAKCLWLLCDTDSKVFTEATEMVRKLSAVVGLNDDKNAKLGTVLKELLDGVSV